MALLRIQLNPCIAVGQRHATKYNCDLLPNEDSLPDSSMPLLAPRSYGCLYNRILAGCHIQQRPETKFCQTCRKLPAMREEITALSAALTETGDLERWNDDRTKAEERFKFLQVQIESLTQHEQWLKTQRAAVLCILSSVIIVS